MKIIKGDTIKVVSGTDAGKTGRVIKVYPNRERIIVEGVNIVKKHARPTQENPQGGIIEKESTIHISNVKLVVGNKESKIGYKLLKNGKKVRVAKINGNTIS
tara:strand:- start:604 stop:909 length:306 start_codon:yes stop_codon:yes gene_type:complete